MAVAAAAAGTGPDTTAGTGDEPDPSGAVAGGTGATGVVGPIQTKPKRFYTTVVLDATRLGCDPDRVSEEVLSHLASPQGALPEVTPDIEVKVPHRHGELPDAQV